MQPFVSCLFLLASATPARVDATNPVSKVIEMLSGLQAKMIVEAAEQQKLYDAYAEGCEDQSKEIGFEIKTGKAQVASLEATITEATATIAACSTKADELASAIATNEADLSAATGIRGKEAAEFAAEEKELAEMVDMLERAIAILERELKSGGASMIQMKSAGTVAQALKVLVQFSGFSSADASRLTALVQSSDRESDGDAEMGAPDADVYEGHSGGIIDTMEGLLTKAQGQLDTARKTEMQNLHNYEVLRQSLTDEINYGNDDLAKAKKCVSENEQTKATAEGELTVTSKDLAEDIKALAELHHECMTKATEFEQETKSRDEELKALAEAKAIISKSTGGEGGAEDVAYGLTQVSLLQLSRSHLSTGADLANYEAVRYIRDLARKMKSPELAQLASRMKSAIRMGSGAAGPFDKVKGLITDLIARLEAEAAAAAAHKEHCDKEFKETYASKDKKDATIAKLDAAIDQAKARSALLKGEVATLVKELAKLAQYQMELDTQRAAEKALYDKNLPEMQEGLEGVKLGLKILREYYGKDKSHGAAEGAAGDILGLLEVVESDFSKLISEMMADEESSEKAYEAQTKENEITKATKDQDVKYKTKEFTGLDKTVTELSADLASVEEELAAVMEYLSKLKDMCIAKPETYEERKARREQEIAGLKAALEILEGEALLLQTGRKTLRGATA